MPQKLQKKGVYLPNDVMITIVMVLIGFFVVAALAQNLMAEGGDVAVDLACRASIAARAKSVIRLGSECLLNAPVAGCIIDAAKVNTIPFLCQTKRLKTSGSKDEVMHRFAKLMEATWGTFSEGIYPFTIEDKGNEGDVCFPAYILLVGKIEGSKQGNIKNQCDAGDAKSQAACEKANQDILTSGDNVISGQEFVDYLRTHYITAYNESESYYDYFTYHNGVPGKVITPPYIQENHAYYIMYADPDFKYAKESPYNGVYVMDVEQAHQIPTWKEKAEFLDYAGLVGGGIAVIGVVVFTGGGAVPFIVATAGVTTSTVSGAKLISLDLSKGKPCTILTGYGGL